MLIKVHAMHVMLCVGPVSGPAVQHMYVCTVQCTAQHSTVQCIVHVCILAWCRVMSPASPALCTVLAGLHQDSTFTMFQTTQHQQADDQKHHLSFTNETLGRSKAAFKCSVKNNICTT